MRTIFLDGVYSPDGDGKGQMFHPSPAPTQDEIEALVGRASKRILRFLQRRGVITLVTAPGDGEIAVVADETMNEKDPLMARLLAAATAGAEPAGPANKRKVIRIVLDPDDRRKRQARVQEARNIDVETSATALSPPRIRKVSDGQSYGRLRLPRRPNCGVGCRFEVALSQTPRTAPISYAPYHAELTITA